jgi:hypothetical protein
MPTPSESSHATSPDVKVEPGGRFEPPTGAAPGRDGDGPWNRRLALAVSLDGLSFHTADDYLSDQAVDAAVVEDVRGWIYAYYRGWTVGPETDRLAVARSDDGGTTWLHLRLDLSGLPDLSNLKLAGAHLLPNGTFRLFVGRDDGGETHLHRLEGSDGIRFADRGPVFAAPAATMPAPRVLRWASQWHLYGGDSGGDHTYARSTDGVSFVAMSPDPQAPPAGWAFGSAVSLHDGTHRAYGYRASGDRILSWSTSDGASWAQDPGERLEPASGSAARADPLEAPAVVLLAGGWYLMAYTTSISFD